MAGDAFIIFQTKVAREGERRRHRAKGREGDRAALAEVKLG